jgi:hypothetical protein
MDKQLKYTEIVKELRNYEYWCGSSGKYARDIHPHICERAADMIESLQAKLTESRAREDAAVECVEAVEFSLAGSHFSDAWAAIRKWRSLRGGETNEK